MIVRIVKLKFSEQYAETFLDFFEGIKWRVSQYPGCLGMQLLRDETNPSTFLTYSMWESEDALNNYRGSSTFGEVWPKIKPWFAASPEAWTTQTVFSGFEVKSIN